MNYKLKKFIQRWEKKLTRQRWPELQRINFPKHVAMVGITVGFVKKYFKKRGVSLSDVRNTFWVWVSKETRISIYF